MLGSGAEPHKRSSKNGRFPEWAARSPCLENPDHGAAWSPDSHRLEPGRPSPRAPCPRSSRVLRETSFFPQPVAGLTQLLPSPESQDFPLTSRVTALRPRPLHPWWVPVGMGWTVGGSEPVLPPGGFPKLSPPRPPPSHLSSSCIHLVMGDSPPPFIQSLRGSRPEPVLAGSSCSETRLQWLSCAITPNPAEPRYAV